MPAVADDLFKAIADPTPGAIFERLARDGEETVHVLTDSAGVSQTSGLRGPRRSKARQIGARPA